MRTNWHESISALPGSGAWRTGGEAEIMFFSSFERGGLRRDLIDVFSYLMEGYRDERAQPRAAQATFRHEVWQVQTVSGLNKDSFSLPLFSSREAEVPSEMLFSY